MKRDELTVPLMERAYTGNQHLNGICVSGRSRELLFEIRDLLDVFAPDGGGNCNHHRGETRKEGNLVMARVPSFENLGEWV